jgi:hypothetical protein
MADRVEPAAKRALQNLPFRSFRNSQAIYLRHILGLLQPGRQVVVPAAHQVQASSLDNWTEEDLTLMIEEGRRQLDRQYSDFEHLLSRAQWLFTVGAAVIASLVAAFAKSQAGGPPVVLRALAFAFVVYGVAGAGAIMVVRADFSTIDTATLSQRTPPIRKELAGDYSAMLGKGENTVAARLTVFHEAVLYLVIGGILGLVAVVAHW